MEAAILLYWTIQAKRNSVRNRGRKWLVNELETSQAFSHRFVIMHVPLYDPREGDYKKGHSLEDIKLSIKRNDLFDRYAVDMLFCSHIHTHFRGVLAKNAFHYLWRCVSTIERQRILSLYQS